jgi:hypothetical protein
MSLRIRSWWCAGVAVLSATTAGAQTTVPKDWTHGTVLQGSAGIVTGQSMAGLDLGGGFGWEITPRFAVEATGSWITFDSNYDAFAGSLALRTRLWGERKIDPFVLGGVGLYHTSFACGGTPVPGEDAQPCSVTASIPQFYLRRLTSDLAGWQTFTDPTLVVGGGVSLFLNRHFAIRPDVRVAFVLDSGDSYVVTTVAIQAAYHFEAHPITPARR